MKCPYEQVTTDALRALRLEPSDREVVAHGLHAGFPLCCIYFYARIWTRWCGEVPELYEASNHDPDEDTRRLLWKNHPDFMRSLDEKFSYLDESGWDVGYVRCPWCVVNDHRVHAKPVDTLACTCWANPRAP